MRNKTLRLTALLLSVLMLSGVISGCGEEEEVPQIILRTASIMGDDGAREAYTSLLEAYSAEYPHVYHMSTLAETANAYKLDATFESTYTASRYPHAVYYYTDTGIEALSEHFVSVEEIRESYPDFAAGITDAAFDSVRADDGKVYCVPFAGSWTALAVNTAMFERYSLPLPDTWQKLVTAAGVFSARGITAIANPPDDSAALLELICLANGGEEALDSALSEQPLAGETDRDAWLNVFRLYRELSGINSFPAAMKDSEVTAALEQLALVEAAKAAQTVSSGDVSASDAAGSQETAVSETDASEPTVRTDAIRLFNSGEAAMIIIDSDNVDRITRDDYTLVIFPYDTETYAGDGQCVLAGGYGTGWFITRRAFNDNTVRDAVVSFVDSMVGGKAADSFVQMGVMPSVVSDGDLGTGLYGMAENADRIVRSRRTALNSARFSALEQIAAALSMGIITPEQAVELAADPSLRLTDVIEQPPAQTASPVPTTPTSASDT